MGTWTFADMKDYLTLQIRERTDAASIGSVDFTGIWVNAAYIQLTTKNRFWGLKKDFYFPQLHVNTTDSTADGTATVDSGTDTLYIEEVYDTTNNKRLDWIPWSKYLGYTDRTNTSAEGKPTEWHRKGTLGSADIFLHPTPDAVYTITIYYRKVPAVLTGTSTTLIGAEWDEPILQLAVIKAHQWLKIQPENIKLMKAEWTEMVAGLIGIYEKEEKARREHVKPDGQYITKRGYG